MKQLVCWLAAIFAIAVTLGCQPKPGSCGTNTPVITNIVVTDTADGGSAVTSHPSVGDTVALTAIHVDPDETTSVCKPASKAPTYEWTLVKSPAGSAQATPVGSQPATITFTADVAGLYQWSVVATDPEGLSSKPAMVWVATGPCGPTLGNAPASFTQPIGVSVGGSPASTVPGGGYVLTQGATATLSTATPQDRCVQGGAPPSKQWSLAAVPAGSNAVIYNPSADAPSFGVDKAGIYAVQLVLRDNGGNASVYSTTLNANPCVTGPQIVTPVAVSSLYYVNGSGTSGGTINRGDVVGLALPLSVSGSGGVRAGTCSSQLFYDWAMIGRPSGSTAALSSTSAASPSFVADVANGLYTFSVVVRDGLGNASAPYVFNLQTSACGTLPPTVQLVPGYPVPAFTLTQALAVNGGMSLQLTRSSDPSRDAALLNGGYAGVAAAFYPRVPIQLSANVGVASLPGCPITLGPIAYQWSILDQPAGSTAMLNNPSAINPSFVPDVPGAYEFQLILTDSSGNSSVNVLARDELGTPPGTVCSCGVMAPAARAKINGPLALAPGSFLPMPNEPIGLKTQLDASGSAAASPNDYPTGCGLRPTLSYHWSVASAPGGSMGYFTNFTEGNPGFSPDLPGAYTLDVAVSDGTNVAHAQVLENAVPGFVRSPVPTGSVMTASTTNSSGNPVIAYWDNSNGTVGVAQCMMNCNSNNPSWAQLPPVDTGLSPLSFAPEDEPRPVAVATPAGSTAIDVAYYTGSSATATAGAHGMPACSLVFAQYSAGSWSYLPLASNSNGCDAAGTVGPSDGRYVSMAMHPYGPVLAYWHQVSGTNAALYMNSCTFALACTSNPIGAIWDFGTPGRNVLPGTSSTLTQYGRWPSVAVETTTGAVDVATYVDLDSTGNYNGVAYVTMASPIATPSSVLVENAPLNILRGRFASLTAGSGTVRIAYRDTTGKALMLARCDGACASGVNWSRQTIPDLTSSDYGRDATLVGDANGNLRIGYMDASNFVIRLIASDWNFSRPFMPTASFSATSGSPGLSLTSYGSSLYAGYNGGTLRSYSGP